MIKFDKEKVLMLHRLLAEQTGGGVGVRDCNLLESAIESAFATFDGKDLYKTLEEKAAQLGFSLISNHAFLDGNKRIGMYVLISFLEMNGINVNASDKDVCSIAIEVAGGKAHYKELLNWINKHKGAK